jgi:serine/tyrosine/threonine adenylyltransferase
MYRDDELDGAVLTRVAASHIRFDTVQWAAAHDDRKALRALADYTRARHYPELADVPDPHLALFAPSSNGRRASSHGGSSPASSTA